jgi:hypothetical protein
MWGNQLSASNGALSSISGQNNDRGQRGLQGSVQIGETLDVQHMNLKINSKIKPRR